MDMFTFSYLKERNVFENYKKNGWNKINGHLRIRK